MEDKYRVEHFESLLAWLDPDRDRAAEEYERIRKSLVQIFTWKGVSDPEWLADKTLDRAISQLSKFKGTYEGDATGYIHAVAKNVLKEEKRSRSVGPLPENQRTTDSENDRMYRCLEQCFSSLSPSSRDLIHSFYGQERTKRQSYRQELAGQLGISPNQLRVRIFNIKRTLKACTEACMQQDDAS